MSTGWVPTAGEAPEAPRNVQVMGAGELGMADIRWDDPSLAPQNAVFTVVGVNVYRSDDSERGPYIRLNAFPVGAPFYRDQTDNQLVPREVVSWANNWRFQGDSPNGCRYILRTRFALHKKGGQAVLANSPEDVQVTIDGARVPVLRLFPNVGEVELPTERYFDPVTEKYIEPVLPDASSSVTVTYYTNRNLVQTDLDKKSFYRLTTVALDTSTPSGFTETPLEYSEPHTLHAIETIDYIWKEAVRRNNWILEQGGERVKLFLKKTSGIPCFCTQDPVERTYTQQPHALCGICFGTGFLGGYTGPFEAIIAPDDSHKRVIQTDTGRRLEHQNDVWMGPFPMLTQRDFLVRQTNERYSIGGIHRPSNRGNILQQHFSIGYLDESDIRYKIPLYGIESLPWPECRIAGQKFYHGLYFGQMDVPYPVVSENRSPMETEKSNIPDDREIRGRTPVWENWMYLWPVLLAGSFLWSMVQAGAGFAF